VISKEEIKRLVKLHSAKGREETGLFLAEGEKVVAEMIASGIAVKTVYYLPGYCPQGLKNDSLAQEISAGEMGRITAFHSPSPVAAVGFIPAGHSPTGTKYVYLDRISDPGNAGTIIRLCHWFGIQHVMFSPGCVEVWNPKLVQASMGSVFHVNVSSGISYEQLTTFTKDGFELVGTHLKGTDIREWKPAEKTILILGSESHGMADEITNACTSLVRIPGVGSAESLNVSAAAAIVMYEWTITT
jgi:RNA methyltransferase, TrmH family